MTYSNLEQHWELKKHKRNLVGEETTLKVSESDDKLTKVNACLGIDENSKHFGQKHYQDLL